MRVRSSLPGHSSQRYQKLLWWEPMNSLFLIVAHIVPHCPFIISLLILMYFLFVFFLSVCVYCLATTYYLPLANLPSFPCQHTLVIGPLNQKTKTVKSQNTTKRNLNQLHELICFGNSLFLLHILVIVPEAYTVKIQTIFVWILCLSV